MSRGKDVFAVFLCGPGCRLSRQLELAEEQIAAIKEAYMEAREELFELFERLKNGEISGEKFLEPINQMY